MESRDVLKSSALLKMRLADEWLISCMLEYFALLIMRQVGIRALINASIISTHAKKGLMVSLICYWLGMEAETIGKSCNTEGQTKGEYGIQR